MVEKEQKELDSLIQELDDDYFERQAQSAGAHFTNPLHTAAEEVIELDPL